VRIAHRRIGRRSIVFVGITVAAALAAGAPARAQAGFGSGTPAFTNYVSPFTPPSSNEPSIGVDWATGAVMYEDAQHTRKVIFNDSTTPATATWTDVTDPTALTTLDPILFTDNGTNRTFESQLLVACSDMGYTDSDGAPTTTAPTGWTQSQGCGFHGAEDHQTVGGGPFHAPIPTLPSPVYGHAVYYCSQDFVNGTAAFCSLSLDGGVTFTPALTRAVYTTMDCGGLHGHIRVAPDGTAYLPNQNCTTAGNGIYTNQGVVLSTTNAAPSTTAPTGWTIRLIPDSKPTFYSDPSVAVGAGGTVYFGYEDGGVTPTAGGGHPKIAVSSNQGVTWNPSVDVGVTLTHPDGSTSPLGIQNTAFPEVIAGDDNRAAFAFLGSTTGGNYQLATFPGSWDLYVALTYDGGAHWTTVDATPNNPVQRGCVWLAGGSNVCRNMLDFNDITVDKQGRVLVAYTKGCTGACVTDPNATNPFSAVPYIARQGGGPGLFANPGATIPESHAVPLLVVGALGLAALPVWWTRRRRNRHGYRSLGPGGSDPDHA
jgi:hypothetical protein